MKRCNQCKVISPERAREVCVFEDCPHKEIETTEISGTVPGNIELRGADLSAAQVMYHVNPVGELEKDTVHIIQMIDDEPAEPAQKTEGRWNRILKKWDRFKLAVVKTMGGA